MGRRVGEGLRFYPWSLIRYDSWCMGLTSNLMVLREIWDKFPELFYKITKFPERSEARWQKLADFWHFCAYLGQKIL